MSEATSSNETAYWSTLIQEENRDKIEEFVEWLLAYNFIYHIEDKNGRSADLGDVHS